MQPSKEVLDYIENEILPQYNGIGGHTDSHIREVMSRSLIFAKQAPGVNIDMVVLIAAFHDLGRLVDNETHNIESGKMVRADKFLKKHFSDTEIEIMAEAVEDHRASLDREPRSIYGKLVSSADRNTSIDVLLGRAYDHGRYLMPDLPEDEFLEKVRLKLRSKYSPDGYAAHKMYFDDPNYSKMLVCVEEITRDHEAFCKLMREFNKKRCIVVE